MTDLATPRRTLGIASSLPARSTMLLVPLASLLAASCKVGVEGAVDVNVDQQNRGTVTGQALMNVPYQDPNGSFVGAPGADIRLTTGDVTTVRNTGYRTTANNAGGFLIEVPAGSYTVYGCRKASGSGGTNAWSGTGSVTVARGATVDAGEIRLYWEQAWRCAYF